MTTTALTLFAATACVVFLLGIQQLNVQGGHEAAAMITSVAISIAQTALYKLAPDANIIETAAFIAGGPVGIVLAMRLHPRIKTALTRGVKHE